MTPQLKTILEPYRGQNRAALLPLLWEVQTAFGHINRTAVHNISHTLRVPEAEIYGVIQFYSLFSDEAKAERVIRVCTDPSCSVANAENLLTDLKNHCATDDSTHCEATTCLGLCEQAPAALISDMGSGEHVQTDIQDVAQLLTNATDYTPRAYTSEIGVLLGETEATLDEYGDYAALRQALQSKDSTGLITTVEDSKLIGRGGAAFPTGLKWKYTRATESDIRYVVVNADESEPGTFKDRVLMETRPHLLLEGMILARLCH